jgi:sec-independent protein translocase protein TatA
MNLGPTELLIVFAIVVLLFGAAKLPKLARGLGESAKEFKSATAAIDSVDEPHDTRS